MKCLFLCKNRSPVNTLSTIIFNTLVRLKVCHKPIRTYDVGSPSAITISLPGMDPVDAERRRYCVQNMSRSGCMPWIILHLWGFLCVGDAGRRGNKITFVLTRISATLEYTPDLRFPRAAVLIRVNALLAWGRGNSSAWGGEGCAWILSFPCPLTFKGLLCRLIRYSDTDILLLTLWIVSLEIRSFVHSKLVPAPRVCPLHCILLVCAGWKLDELRRYVTCASAFLVH